MARVAWLSILFMALAAASGVVGVVIYSGDLTALKKQRVEQERQVESLKEEMNREDVRGRQLEEQLADIRKKTGGGTARWSDGLKGVMDVLSQDHSEFVIASRFAAYADFSAPDAFSAYRALVLKKRDASAKVTLYLLNNTARREQLRGEFRPRWLAYDTAGQDSSKESEPIRESPKQFGELLRAYADLSRAQLPTSLDELVDLLYQREMQVEAEFRRSGVIVNCVEPPQTLTFWIGGRASAAFFGGDGVYVSTEPAIAEFLRGSIPRPSSCDA